MRSELDTRAGPGLSGSMLKSDMVRARFMPAVTSRKFQKFKKAGNKFDTRVSVRCRAVAPL